VATSELKKDAWIFLVESVEFEGSIVTRPEWDFSLISPDGLAPYRNSLERRPDDNGTWYRLEEDIEKNSVTFYFWGREGENVWERQGKPWHHIVLCLRRVRIPVDGFTILSEPEVILHEIVR
jgi:hypothetical protein